jgi:hypothetical protein
VKTALKETVSMFKFMKNRFFKVFKAYFPLLLVFFLFPAIHAAAQEDPFSSFSDPSRIWGNGIEKVIEEAFRLCFKTRILGGRVMNLRMPFAQNNERDKLSDTGWVFLEGGKGSPETLWPAIETIIDSADFKTYIDAVSDGKEKVLIFDIPTQTWTSSRELFELARMKAGAYRGLPHRPYVYVQGKGVEETDVYNYLYCIGLAGMDCSAFVWHTLSYIAKSGGLDLGRSLRGTLGVRPGDSPAHYAGTGFFDSRSREIITVKDEIRNLRPADIILFRGPDGDAAHSAIIQSVDFKRGLLRYLQCTDEAPLAERGVHESFVYFDPASPGMSLADSSLFWSQKRYPPFPGEKASPFSEDGERYRAFPEYGGGKVVRLRQLQPIIEKINKQ